MTTWIRHRFATVGRLGVLLQALLFAATLVAAPVVHPLVCTGACAAAARLSGPALGSETAPACHGSNGRHSKQKGCQCTDDCCSFLAQFVAPAEFGGEGPPTSVALGLLPALPDDARRAPSPQLLPFPTGPPPRA